MRGYDNWKLDNGEEDNEGRCKDCGDNIAHDSTLCRSCAKERAAEERWDRWHNEHD